MAGRQYDPERLERALLLPPPVDTWDEKWTLGQRSWIDVSPDCWHWAGRVDRDGYGRSTNGKIAHRLAFRYWVGPIPDGYHVDHCCHNVDRTCTDGATCLHRRCVRPDHLQARIAVENLADQYTTRRTRCSKGHALTTRNTIKTKGRGRHCRKCRNDGQGSGELIMNPIPPGPPVRPYDSTTGEVSVPLRAEDESAREVVLKGGLIALVDAEDWSLVSSYKWYPRVESQHWIYARGIRNVNGKTEWVVMHRLVAQPLRGQRVYHHNRNGLDNRRSNLRFGPRTRGVTWNSQLGKWRAYVREGDKRRSLGHFATQEDAEQACALATVQVAS